MSAGTSRRVERRAGLSASAATALSALALAPLFTTTTWYTTILTLIIVVTLVGETARWARFPIAVTPLLEFASALAFIVFTYVPDSAPLSFIPSPSALSALRDVLADGGHVINSYTAPVPVSEEIIALTALGVGTALVFVRALQRLGNPALAGTALVGMYLVPVFSLRAGAPWWSFALVLWAVVLLLVNHEQGQLLHWGRVLNKRATWSEDSPRTPGLSATGARMGAVALVAALLIPALTPTFTLPALNFGSGNGPSGGGAGTGIASDPVTLAALVSVRRDLSEQQNRTLIVYRSDDGSPTYLRMVALENFDGTTWSPRKFDVDVNQVVTGGLPPLNEIGDASYETRSYSIQVGPLASHYLPLPYPSNVIDVNGSWVMDPVTRSVLSDSGTTANLTYNAKSPAVTPSVKALRQVQSVQDSSVPVPPAVLDDLALNSTTPAVIRDTAVSVTAKSTTAYDKALALQDYFRSNFTYDLLARSKDDSKLIEDFLTERRGYCEQFASVMALMARAVGIPARVAVGFSPGAQQRDGSWQVGTHQAHAWPELYFQGYGWIRFEPTPRAGDGSGIAPPAWAPYASASSSGSGSGATASDLRDLSRYKKLEYEQAGGGSIGAVTLPASPPATSWSELLRRGVLVLILIVAIAAAMFPSVVRWWRTRKRSHSASPAEAAWDQLRDDVRDYGRNWSDAESPRRIAARLIASERLIDEPARSMRRLSNATEIARYAPRDTVVDDRPGIGRPGIDRPGIDRESNSVMDDADVVRRALAQGSSWRVRWSARLFPKSVLSRRDRG